MHIKCLKSRNPHLRSGIAYPVTHETNLAWYVADDRGYMQRASKAGTRWAGAEDWRLCAPCNPNVESGPAIQIPATGTIVEVTPTFGAVPWVPYRAKFMGTFDAGDHGTGVMVQDAEGYLIHIWPNTAKWRVSF